LITFAVSMSSSVKMRSPRPGLGRPTACISSRRNIADRPASRATWLSEWRPRTAERELDGQARQALLGGGALDLVRVGAGFAQASEQPLTVAHRSIQARIWSYTAGWLSRSKCVSPPR
jgi:hypothetical protein